MSIAKDTLFELDNFASPKIVSETDSWVHNIMDVLLLEKGTFSDTPEMGVNLKSINYLTAEEMVTFLQNEIKEQCDSYLSDIPLDDILISLKEQNNGDVSVIITLGFNTRYGKVSRSVFVDIRDEIIDYIVDKFDKT